MKRRFWFGKAVMILVFCTAFVMLFSFIVMSLWNAILPAVLGVKMITFWQALGILVLSKILFSGFGGFAHKREHFRNRFRQKMMDKWEKMTPEEKQKFKDEWKNRCRGWGGRFNERNFTTKEPGSTDKPDF
jgi:Ca2+/H+ antiporter, TMEM165/GDT1 family